MRNAILVTLAVLALASNAYLWGTPQGREHLRPVSAEDATGTPYRIFPVGDANCSGHTTAVDALLVLHYDAGLAEREDLACFDNADVNLDDRVGPRDAALILQDVAGIIRISHQFLFST